MISNMDAESMKNQEQLHIKDNETLQVEKSDDVKFCTIDSFSDSSPTSTGNITNNFTEVVSTSMQTSTDSHDNEASCQSDKQSADSLDKPMTINIDSKADDTVDVKSQSLLELSDDYLTQMMNKVNDREIAIYAGSFLVSNETESSQDSDHAENQNSLSVGEPSVLNQSNKADNNVTLDNIEKIIDNAHTKEDTSKDTKETKKELAFEKIKIVEKTNNTTVNLDLKEKPVLTDNAHIKEADNNRNIDTSDTSRQNLLPEEANSSDEEIDVVGGVEYNDTMVNLDLKEKPLLTDDAHAEEADSNRNSDTSDTSSQEESDCSSIRNIQLIKYNDTNSDRRDTSCEEEVDNSDKEIEEIEMIRYNDTMVNLDLKEKPLLTDDAHAEKADNNRSIAISDTSSQNILPSIFEEANSLNDTKETEKELALEKIDIAERTNDAMVNLDLEEKPVLTDDAHAEEVEKNCIGKSIITNKQDFSSSEEHFIVDKSNNLIDVNKSENEYHSKNIDKSEPAAVDANENQSYDGKIPVANLEHIDVKKGFCRRELKDVNSTQLIDSMQNMDWLKHSGGGMEGNRRKLSRKPSMETEDCQDVKKVKQEPIEDAKLSSKSSKRRSSQSKSRKAKAADPSKQVTSEDRNKKSSDVQLANTSKNETSKSTNARAFEKSKDTKSSPQIPELQRSSIGRGRNDRRKVSLGNSQPKAQNDFNDQWNRTPRVHLEIPTMEDENCNKNEVHSRAQSSSVEVEVQVPKVKDFIDNAVVTDSRKSEKSEVCEKEVESRSSNQPDTPVFLHNQSSIKKHENEPLTQKSEEKIDMKEEQLPSVKNDQDSQSKSGTNFSSRPIYGRSTDESNSEKIPLSSLLSVKGFVQNNSNKQDSYAIHNTGFHSTPSDPPRWNQSNHNNYSGRQNTKSIELSSQKGFTSNKHRHITEDEKKQNEESFRKNQASADKFQGNKGYSDKCYDSRTSGGRYNERSHDHRHSNSQYSDRNQDHRNYSERNSTRNQDGRSYSDILSDKNQNNQGDRFFLNQNNKGFGENYSERFQEKANGERYSDKLRDSKNVTNRYPDRNQQSKSFHEISSERGHDGNQMTVKKPEPSIRPLAISDKNNDPDKYQDIRSSSNKSLNATKETLSKSQLCAEGKDINVDCGRKNQGTSSNVQNISKKNQEMLDRYQDHFWEVSEKEDYDKVKQNKPDVKSQKHYDNTQQAKAQRGLQVLQETFSAHQPELSSSVDQNVKLHEKNAHSVDLTNTQPIQSEDWALRKNTSKPDLAHSTDLRCSSPYANINMTANPTVTNEYVSQYDETLLNSSNQFNYISNAAVPEQKPNVVMAFEGNQNVQRALGIDRSHFNQSQSSQVNTSDLFRSNANSPTPQQLSTSANAAQYYRSITSSLMNPPTTSAYVHSTMNVNALPFEVTASQKTNDQSLYTVQSAILNSRAGVVTSNIDDRIAAIRMNEISNNSEKQLKVLQEISELRKKLAIKQAELMALQMESINLQENQPLPSNYVQVKQSNIPPGFGDVSLNVQSTQMNVYEMSTNVANVQNYLVEKSPLNIVSKPKINAQPVYLAQGTVYQRQVANNTIYTDKTANSAAHNVVPQTAEQRQIRGSIIQYSEQ